jgi:hypothetical protein
MEVIMLIEKIVSKLRVLIGAILAANDAAIAEIARQLAKHKTKKADASKTEAGAKAPPPRMAWRYAPAPGRWAGFEWDPETGTYKNQQGTPATPVQILADLESGLIIDSPSETAAKSPAPLEKMSDTELLFAAQRIVAAFELEKRGVTSEMLISGVRQFEKAFAGVVQ